VAKGKGKLPKRLFKATERASSYEHDRSPSARIKHVSRDHQDVLQNIEFVLVTLWRKDDTIDDRTVSVALRAAIAGTEPDEPRAAELFRHLASIPETREDVDDTLWKSALRVVDESVHTHSQCGKGETSYLRFVSPFLA
jgi:hypothetical protein